MVARVTAGLAESDGSRVYDSRHLQADCQEPGSALEPYARQSSMVYLYVCTALQCSVDWLMADDVHLSREVEVKSYNFRQFVLAYGPAKCYTV